MHTQAREQAHPLLAFLVRPAAQFLASGLEYGAHHIVVGRLDPQFAKSV
jgi:hypothetical protein